MARSANQKTAAEMKASADQTDYHNFVPIQPLSLTPMDDEGIRIWSLVNGLHRITNRACSPFTRTQHPHTAQETVS